MRKLPPNRRIAVICALVAVFAALMPILIKAAPAGYADPAAFVVGLAVGLTFAIGVGLFVKGRRSPPTGDPS